jgi:hypothetical protein
MRSRLARFAEEAPVGVEDDCPQREVELDLSKEEYAALEGLARRNGLTVSGQVRRCVLLHLADLPAPKGDQKDPHPEET